MKTKLFFLIGVILFLSCHKKKPNVGNYHVSLTYSQSWKENKSFDISISETNQNWFTLGDPFGNQYFDTVYKNKSKVEGRLTPSLYIKGKIKRVGISSNYKIIGTFTSVEYTQSSGTFNYNGTFEMK